MKFLGERYGVVREWLKDFSRDGDWRPTRTQFITKFNRCECCGRMDTLNVHHINPVRWFPQLELEPYNLITLCRKHHFYYGHFGNWKDWNPYIWQMAQMYSKGQMEFESDYDRYAVFNQTPDYEKIIKDLKQSQGRLITKGKK
jgi:hypothetical protein